MSDYHKLPIAQKRMQNIARVREPAVSCPDCDTQVMPADLLQHLQERCAGPRDPGPSAKWVTWAEARKMGVPKQTLSRWASSGLVRSIGGRMDRKYLHRDLALKIAQRRGFHRR